VEENIDELVDGLTKWEPSIEKTGVLAPEKITVKGMDYEEAVANMNDLFLQNQWGDGLPLVPPTEERVNWILRGTDLAPDTVVGTGKVQPRGGIATVETIAVNLAMAGGRPEYLPVLIAAVETMLAEELHHGYWQGTSSSVYPAVIVNGPIAGQIRFNSGFGLLGPHPSKPAGGVIGRALRLFQQNAGGAVAGIGTMAQFGGMRYTNAVFAEDEAGLPQDWEPLSVEYFGYPKGANTVTTWAVTGATQIYRWAFRPGLPLEESVLQGNYRMAESMRIPIDGFEGYDEGTPGILIINALIAQQEADTGWTKEAFKEFMWENSKLLESEIVRNDLIHPIEKKGLDDTLKDGKWPLWRKAENLVVVVAGGAHPTYAFWMASGYMGEQSKPAIAEIKLPAAWDELLKEAEEDLGPPPGTTR
jgi:hypothetical protein